MEGACLVEHQVTDASTVDFSRTPRSASGRRVQAIGLVAETASAEEARQAIAALPERKDLFVTATGQAIEALKGWVTDADRAGFSS